MICFNSAVSLKIQPCYCTQNTTKKKKNPSKRMMLILVGDSKATVAKLICFKGGLVVNNLHVFLCVTKLQRLFIPYIIILARFAYYFLWLDV